MEGHPGKELEMVTVAISEGVVSELVNLRQDWEQAGEGKSLIETYGSIGLLLADFVFMLGLTPGEQVQVLGEELYSEVKHLL